ncbi:MAG: hypothetical protein ACW96X_07430 [Promethearchaeota archaeon]|jgi:hypothetical protein
MKLDKPLDFDDFITLIEYTAIEKKSKKWKVICLTTDFEEFSELEEKLSLYDFDINKHGDILEVSFSIKEKIKKEEKENFTSFIVKHNGLFLFFSNENKDDINNYFINNFVRRAKNIYYMWIPKKIIESLIEEFEAEYDKFLITKFYSERNLRDNTSSHFREGIERKIEYSGFDGLEVIKEFKFYYGVRPYIVDFNILDKSSFRINRDGFFTYESGKLNFLIKIIEKIYKKVKIIVDLTRSSYYKEIPKRDIKVKTLDIQPIKISFNSYELDTDNFNEFTENLKLNGFEVFDLSIESGSIKLNTDIIDINKKAIFNISSGGKELVITPRFKTTFDTIFRFLEIINEHIDSESKYELFRNPLFIQETS